MFRILTFPHLLDVSPDGAPTVLEPFDIDAFGFRRSIIEFHVPQYLCIIPQRLFVPYSATHERWKCEVAAVAHSPPLFFHFISGTLGVYLSSPTVDGMVGAAHQPFRKTPVKLRTHVSTSYFTVYILELISYLYPPIRSGGVTPKRYANYNFEFVMANTSLRVNSRCW